jgi:hypothetical protein
MQGVVKAIACNSRVSGIAGADARRDHGLQFKERIEYSRITTTVYVTPTQNQNNADRVAFVTLQNDRREFVTFGINVDSPLLATRFGADGRVADNAIILRSFDFMENATPHHQRRRRKEGCTILSTDAMQCQKPTNIKK